MNDRNEPRRPLGFDTVDDHDELAHLGQSTPGASPGEISRELASLRASRDASRALFQVAVRITGQLEFRPLLEEILDCALETLGGGRGVIFLGKGGPRELVPVVRRAVGNHEIVGIQKLSTTILAAAQAESGIHSADATQDDRFADAESLQSEVVRSVMCLPMYCRGKRTGLIYVDRSTTGGYSQAAREFFEAFVSLAALAIDNARSHDEVRRENSRIREKLATRDAFGRIVGSSPPMEELIERAKVVASVSQPVVLLGESGTGKELLARAIHESSSRALEPFIAYNCAAVPSELMESLFFGHKKGAFSGAFQDSPGLFRKAEKGVLFLDEIAELDGKLQAKLLRVLQENTIWSIGAESETPVDVRILTATSKNLPEEVRRGRFREDLLYRLCVLELQLPPLRERTEDIPLLVRHFVESDPAAHRDGVEFRPDALRLLQSLAWRGNVRELENTVQRVIVLRESNEIDADQVRKLLSEWTLGLPLGPPLGGSDPADAHRSADSETTNGAPHGGSLDPALSPADGILTITERERAAVLEALAATDGNKTQAAAILGIHRNSLVRRMQRLGIG